VLDIGAGTGDFVSFLGERGFAAEGIEPALVPSEAARDRGLKIFTADLDTWAADAEHSGQYDAVIALNVLEHVPDPEAFVARCLKLLSASGILALKVPNDFSELQAAAQKMLQKEPWWICAPDHVNYFNIASLRKFLESFGLEIVGQVTDFPMELFLLFGDDYTGNAEVGKQMHAKRQQLESALPHDLRRKLYAAFAAAGMGRAVTVFARK
jgi:SAM-dependent methyltransferase